MPGTGDVVEVDFLKLFHPLDALGDSLEVGEHATEPALVDIGLADAGSLFCNSFLCLLLRADKENGSAVRNGGLDEFVGPVNVGQRLLQVDDVDAVAFGEDETLHLRVPTAGLVTEVDAAVEQLAHGYYWHVMPFFQHGFSRQGRCTDAC